MREEAAAEGLKPFLNGLAVVFVAEGLLCEQEDLGRTEAEAHEIVEEEIVKLVGSDEVFGLLLDIAIGVGRGQLGRDGCVDDVEQRLALGGECWHGGVVTDEIWMSVLGMPALTPYIDMWSPL